MNYRGLKHASRQSLADSGINPRRLTFLFVLCIYLVTVPTDLITYFLNKQLDSLTGLSAANSRGSYAMWSIVSTIVINVLINLWSCSYAMFALHLSRKEQAGFRDFFAGFRLAGKVLCLLFLQVLYTSLWAMLFIVPGFVAAYSYRLAIFALFDNPSLSASQAIDESKRLTYGHKGELFALDLRFWWYYVPFYAASIPLYLYDFGYLSIPGKYGYLCLVVGYCLIDIVMKTVGYAHLQTTHAHAYNWLVWLDKDRRNAAKREFEQFREKNI